eukprot:TRINITY_DN10560_c0_g1_i2.p2 TRINITY_DN10560_c0_g1~~TRINITY_DN10560_c0_g1_i2.p2  ORF type:complete len:111 (+),score=17.61 TRINITY_DN10560_c0_g1_i2:452-784(+)
MNLVLFHPLARAGLPPPALLGPRLGDLDSLNKREERAEDFGARAPFPTIHFLREMDVARVSGRSQDARSIPARNSKHLGQIGLEGCRKRLAMCLRPAPHGVAEVLEHCMR